MTLVTVGHGTLAAAEMKDLLHGAGIGRVVDVRTAPGSRRYPHFGRAALEEWLPATGIAYRWEPRLGGWRKPMPGSPNTALGDGGLRGYADYMRTPPFWEGLDELLAEALESPTACMCSESLWWGCHRRLLSDAVVKARGGEVLHLLHDGDLVPHETTESCRLDGAGLLIYDLGRTPRLPGVD